MCKLPMINRHAMSLKLAAMEVGSRLQLNNRGTVRSESRIGNCRQRLNPANIASLLEGQGYERVEVIKHRIARQLCCCDRPGQSRIADGRGRL